MLVASSIIFGFLPKKKIGSSVRKHPSRCPLKACFLVHCRAARFCFVSRLQPHNPSQGLPGRLHRRVRVCFDSWLPRRPHVCFASRQQPNNPPQGLPGRLVQCRVRPQEVADHLPGSNVKSALGWKSRSQGDRARRAETDPPRRRLLPRFYSHTRDLIHTGYDGLREQIYSYGLLSCLELPITAMTAHVFQKSPPGGYLPRQNTVSTRQRGASA